MNGLELSRAYYETYGKPMLAEFLKEYPGLEPHIAAGLIGSGSECLGFDDEVSQDHDYEPGFCIFLPGEDIVDRRSAFLLERAYAKLPKEFMGFTRPLMQPVGGARRGVLRTEEFLKARVGTESAGILIKACTASPEASASAAAPLDPVSAPAAEASLNSSSTPAVSLESVPISDWEWLTFNEQSLLEVTNGELFCDPSGDLTRIRQALAFYPEHIRRKKLAGHLLLMAQAGQYNYQRCIRHGESAAAQLAVFEFTKSAISAIFLLNRRYQPYYKWSFRALRSLDKLSIEAELLEFLITSGNDEGMAEEKYNVIEGIAADVIDELMAQNLTQAVCGDLEKHAYSVNDGIEDGALRNLHILGAV